MPRPERQKFSQKEFGERLESALEMNPNAPPKFSGERVWLAEEMAKRGKPVTTETIRKWINGLSMPVYDKSTVLADALGVDVNWLLYGEHVAAQGRASIKKNASAAAATNIVAGIIQMNGGDAIFPADDRDNDVHLNAIIKRVSYPLHVVPGEILDAGEIRFDVPMNVTSAIVVGLVRTEESGFSYRMFEIDDATVKDANVVKGRRQVETKTSDLREITSFDERL